MKNVIIRDEELEKTLLDVNVFQWPHKEESFRREVHTRVDCLAWNHLLSPNPHALTIYLKFIHACGAAPKRFEKC
jgi:hypothetical protein